MSKGLSQQQLHILGLAVAVSRYRNGTPIGRTPRADKRYRVPIVTGVHPDVSTALAAHILAGVGVRPRSREWCHDEVYMETTPKAQVARASISRAITSLIKRGCLAYRPWVYEENGTESGYSLTDAGLAIGLLHEPVIPDLDCRIWVLNKRKNCQDMRNVDVPYEWRVAARRFMPGYVRQELSVIEVSPRYLDNAYP